MGDLGDEQQFRERALPDAASRTWNTARYPGEVAEALLSQDVPSKVLVIGCGVDEAAEYADVLPNAHIDGVDFHRGVIDAAQAQYPRQNVSYQAGDMLEETFVTTLEPESYGAIVLTGVLTNVVEPNQLQKLFHHIDALLARGGRIIISDYLYQEPVGNGLGWDVRYMMNAVALHHAGRIAEDDIPNWMGVFATRPGGQSAVDAMYLGIDELADALRSGNYERLVRHWHPYTLMHAIIEATQGDVFVHDAVAGDKEYDPEPTNSNLNRLRPALIVLEKQGRASSYNLTVQRALLEVASGLARQSGSSYELFFNVLKGEF